MPFYFQFTQVEPRQAARPQNKPRARPKKTTTNENNSNDVIPSTSTERPKGVQRSLRVMKLNCNEHKGKSSEVI